MKISEKIYRLRTENGLTQEQMGKYANVSGKTISSWELGTRDPKVKSLKGICAHFGLDLNVFIDEQNDIYNHVKNNNMVTKTSPLPSESELDAELISRLMQLTPEEEKQVDAFVQGLLASRSE